MNSRPEARHPFDAISPALEEGLSSLESMSRVPALPQDPYARARMLVLSDTVKGCVALSRGIGVSEAAERAALALIRRADVRLALTFSCLENQLDPHDCMLLHSFAALETAAALGKMLPDHSVRQAVDFILPECQDQVYRLANIESESVKPAQDVLGCSIEIMPGRPLIACHRHPYDGLFSPTEEKDFLSRITPFVLMSVFDSLYSRHMRCPDHAALHMECALIEEQHRSMFASLRPAQPPLEQLLLAESALWYLFNSFAPAEEACPELQGLYRREQMNILAHIRKLEQMISKKEGQAPARPELPPPLILSPSKGYVRDTMKQLGVTARRDQWVPVGSLPRGADFFRYQRRLCPRDAAVPSHAVVQHRIEDQGADYRYEIAQHPIPALRSRTRDETHIGR